MPATLQLIAVLPETPVRLVAREPLLEFDRSEHPFDHVAGRVTIPDGQGPGIEIGHAAVERFAAAG